jgi:hypothetical protein
MKYNLFKGEMQQEIFAYRASWWLLLVFSVWTQVSVDDSWGNKHVAKGGKGDPLTEGAEEWTGGNDNNEGPKTMTLALCWTITSK